MNAIASSLWSTGRSEEAPARVIPLAPAPSPAPQLESVPILQSDLKWEPERLISESEDGEIIVAQYARDRQKPELVQQATLLYREGLGFIRRAAGLRAGLRATLGDYEFTRVESVYEAELRLAEQKRIASKLKAERRKAERKQRLHLLCELDEKYRDLAYQDAMQNLEARRDSDGPALSTLRRADEIARQGRGLQRKAQRQIACCLYGQQYDGTVCGQPQGYRFFRCKNRYCPQCGPAIFTRYFGKYLELEAQINAFLAANPSYRLRILDLTTRSSGEMPESEEIRRFECDVKKLRRRIAEYLGVPTRSIAYLYCTEFGFENCNLHCHGLLLSPYIEQERISQWWREIRADGAFRVYIAEATSFRDGLAHALEYTGKYAAGTPERAVALELAFHGCRRVHVLGWLYGLVREDDQDEGPASPPCPCGKQYCQLLLRTDLGWQRISYFEQQQIPPLMESRSDVAVAVKPGGVT
jgi:hypothetical protein